MANIATKYIILSNLCLKKKTIIKIIEMIKAPSQTAADNPNNKPAVRRYTILDCLL